MYFFYWNNNTPRQQETFYASLSLLNANRSYNALLYCNPSFFTPILFYQNL